MHTFRFCNTSCFSTATMVAGTHERYTYIACLVVSLFLSVFGRASCLFQLPHFMRAVPEIFSSVEVVVCSPLLSSVMVFE